MGWNILGKGVDAIKSVTGEVIDAKSGANEVKTARIKARNELKVVRAQGKVELERIHIQGMAKLGDVDALTEQGPNKSRDAIVFVFIAPLFLTFLYLLGASIYTSIVESPGAGIRLFTHSLRSVILSTKEISWIIDIAWVCVIIAASGARQLFVRVLKIYLNRKGDFSAAPDRPSPEPVPVPAPRPRNIAQSQIDPGRFDTSRNIEVLVIHCSDSNVPSHDNVETIRKWHVEENGWADIGYHFVVTKDGEMHDGRSIDKTPAAQKGHNKGSIAVCLTGSDNFSPRQFATLRSLIDACKEAHPSIVVLGHKDLDPSKTCPNFNVKDFQ